MPLACLVGSWGSWVPAAEVIKTESVLQPVIWMEGPLEQERGPVWPGSEVLTLLP